MNRHEKALAILHEGTVIPATPLAIDENRRLDEKTQRRLMRYYLACGVGGIATAVHTTQFEIRRPEHALFEPILRIVAEEIDRFEEKGGKTIVRVCGVCGETAQAVAEAKLAKQYGYDAVLLSPGGLGHLSEAELIERTRAVAAEMPIIAFYLQTAVGGRYLSYDYWQKICAIENVVAVKCASFNRYQTLEVVRAAALSPRSDKITLYTGNDDNIVIDLLTEYTVAADGEKITKGFEGGLLGHWSVQTKKAVEIFNTVKNAKSKGEISPDLLTLAEQVTDANSAFFDTVHNFAGCIAGLHLVLKRQGLMKNIYCLNPDESLSDGQKEEIDRVCAAYPELCDDDFIRSHIKEWE